MFWLQSAEQSNHCSNLSTMEVVDHHIQCFRDGDIDGMMSDYSDDAILFTPDRLLKGREPIAALFSQLLQEFQKAGASDTVRIAMIEGNYAYIIWSAETPDNIYEYATDTFVIGRGKIVMQSFAAKILSKQFSSVSL
jgi:hypothetical protein